MSTRLEDERTVETARRERVSFLSTLGYSVAVCEAEGEREARKVAAELAARRMRRTVESARHEFQRTMESSR